MSFRPRIIASCPACRNNFRSFYCEFTCSPDQSTFLRVAQTQLIGRAPNQQEAVKEVEYYVSDAFRDGFFDSCKDVQFAAINSFAMDLIGGKAKDSRAFVKFMGKESSAGLGSPFQISFPEPSTVEPEKGISPLAAPPLVCSDPGLASRCTCVDCPSICLELPYLPPPAPPHQSRCHIGALSCTSFVLILGYSLVVLAILGTYAFNLTLRARQRRWERHALFAGESGVEEGDAAPLSPNGIRRGRDREWEDSTGDRDSFPNSHRSGSSHMGMGRASLLEQIDALQPRQSKINVTLRRMFYKLGLFCAKYPCE